MSRPVFDIDNLRHIADNAAQGDDTDADTVCIMAMDLARALRIEEVARGVCDRLHGVYTYNGRPVDLTDLQDALAADAPDLLEDSEGGTK